MKEMKKHKEARENQGKELEKKMASPGFSRKAIISPMGISNLKIADNLD